MGELRMARFLFLSWSTPGHVDYGGLSFLRLANLLRASGDEVSWAFTQTGWGGAFKTELERWVGTQGVPISPLTAADLTLPIPEPCDANSYQQVLSSVRSLADFLRAEHIGVLVADRRCTLAGISAHMAGVPWVAIGTDGRCWTEHVEKDSYHSMPGRLEN